MTAHARDVNGAQSLADAREGAPANERPAAACVTGERYGEAHA
jgi:hypothetical protein